MENKQQNWLKDCEICQEGLCQAMRKTMSQGLKESNAAEVLAEVVEKRLGYPLYSSKQLLDRYRYHTNKDKKEIPKTKGRHTKLPVKRDKNRKSQAPISANSNLQVIRAELRVIAESLLPSAALADYVPLVHLRNAKKEFYRDVNNPPNNMTAEESAAWEYYFACAEIASLTQKLQQYYKKQLPDELPENKARRGRPRKQS